MSIAQWPYARTMQEWAPFFGSCLIALAAMATLIVTARQNRTAQRESTKQHTEALSAAADRELQKWRREELLQAVARALSVVHELQQSVPLVLSAKDASDELANEVKTRTVELVILGERVRLLGADELATAIEKLRSASTNSRFARAQLKKSPRHPSTIRFKKHVIAKIDAENAVKEFDGARIILIEAARTELGVVLSLSNETATEEK